MIFAPPRPTVRLLVLGVVLALTAVLLPVATAPALADSTAERDFACRVNEARVRAGESPLRVADDLTKVARSHSRRMASQSRLYHNPNLGSDVKHWRVVAENVGVGPSVSSIHSALMDSSGHRRNILDSRFTQMGIGVERSGGRIWVTQVFRQPSKSISASRPSCSSSNGTIPVAGDWNGDGRMTPGTFDNGRWRLSNGLSSGADIIVSYGSRGDVPVVGDWNGDGRHTLGIVRRGRWHLKNSLSGGSSDRSFVYGRVDRGDVPLVGDWNGDGKDTIGIVRDGTWHLRRSLSGGPGQISFVYGRVTRGDVPLVGDWNGDGRDRIGIVRDGTWHLRHSLSGGRGQTSFVYGRVSRGDVPVIGDWSRDGVTTAGVVRGSTWHLRDRLSGGSATWSFNY